MYQDRRPGQPIQLPPEYVYKYMHEKYRKYRKKVDKSYHGDRGIIKCKAPISDLSFKHADEDQDQIHN